MRFSVLCSIAILVEIAGIACASETLKAAETPQPQIASPIAESAAHPPPLPPRATYLTQDSESPEGEQEDDKSLADRVEELEKLVEDQSTKLDEMTDQLDQRVRSGHSASTIQITGRIHLDYWAFPGDSPGVNALESGDPFISPQDQVGFRRVRFGFQGDLAANMLYKLEVDFAEAQSPEIKDVYFGWADLPILQTVQIGNQKRPYGLDHLNSSRFNVFMERPFIIEAFNQDSRRLGIVSYGITEDLSYNWLYGVYHQPDISAQGIYISDHYQLELAGRLANTFWYDDTSGGRGYAHWAISGSLAHPDGTAGPGRAANAGRFRTRPEARTENRWLDTGEIDGADWYQLLGLEAVVNVGPLQAVGEYQNVWLQRDPGFGSDLHFHGGYFYLSYFLTGEHVPWDRQSGTVGRVEPFENFFLVERCRGGVGGGWGAWQVAARYSMGDLNDDDILGGVGEAVTLALNWHWTPHSRVQVNAVHGRIDEFIRDDLTSGNYTSIGIRGSVDF